jgi:hypothetical protein
MGLFGETIKVLLKLLSGHPEVDRTQESKGIFLFWLIFFVVTA